MINLYLCGINKLIIMEGNNKKEESSVLDEISNKLDFIEDEIYKNEYLRKDVADIKQLLISIVEELGANYNLDDK
jgi:hypothetical protein